MLRVCVGFASAFLSLIAFQKEGGAGGPAPLAMLSAGSIPVGRQFFALLVLSSRRSGGSSLGFRAGSL